MSESDRMAVAAHLHVLLRRKTGRVTDTEWMASNAEYASEIVRLARAHAVTDDAPELAQWADRLEQAMRDAAQAPQRRPLLQTTRTPGPAAAPAAAPQYVGGIR